MLDGGVVLLENHMTTEKCGALPVAGRRESSDGTRQVKVSVDCGVASAFKESCASAGVSMASAISRFMEDYSGAAAATRKRPSDYSTRRRRRAAIRHILQQLGEIKDCEEGYQSRIPENLQGAPAYESADEFIGLLDEAIDALGAIASV